MSIEPVHLVEIDTGHCSRVFGVGGCPATLGGGVVRKCYNTFATCRARAAYSEGVLTLRYVQSRPGLPFDLDARPLLKDVSLQSARVSIVGSDQTDGQLGRRATFSAVFYDAPEDDRGLDKYRAERITGAAQTDEPGYDPVARGSHATKLRARWPHYTGRAMRWIEGRLEGGEFVPEVTRHYEITDMSGPDGNGEWRIEGRDILDRLSDEKAITHDVSRGILADDLALDDTALTLAPEGIGDTYPESGLAEIGGELVEFTRAGDVLTLTGRGLRGTRAGARSKGDVVQVALHLDAMRVDDFLAYLLRDRAALPLPVLPLDEWEAEVTRWWPAVRLSTVIGKPVPVAEPVREVAELGLMIWPDDEAQKVSIRTMRPVDAEDVPLWTEGGELLEWPEIEDRNDERLTEVYWSTVQLDPLRGPGSAANFARQYVIFDETAKRPEAHGDTRIRYVRTRFFDTGADAVIGALARRVLFRLSEQPRQARVTVDASIRVALGKVVDIECRALAGETGAPEIWRGQIVAKEPGRKIGQTVYRLRAFNFTGRYGVATENARPVYSLSTPAQRARGFYACDPVTGRMSNGDEPYRAS